MTYLNVYSTGCGSLSRSTYATERTARVVLSGFGRFRRRPASSLPCSGLLRRPDDISKMGTSAGYSTLWLALACRIVDRTVTTFEVLDEKAELARRTFELADVVDVVDFVHGDALEHLPDCVDISFCFLDAEKEIYAQCYEAIVPNMVSGGILVADNAINHEEALRPMLQMALTDPRVDALVVPIGEGELMCRKK